MKNHLKLRSRALSASIGLGVASALGLALSVDRASAAGLTFDLRAASVVGGSIDNEKTVSINDNTSVVTFNVYAFVEGTDGNSNNDGLQLAYFNFATSNNVGGFAGSLTGIDGTAGTPTGMTLGGNFGNAGSQRGKPNVDGIGGTIPGATPADGVKDIGSISAQGNTAGDMVKLQGANWASGFTSTSFTDGVPISGGIRTAAGNGYAINSSVAVAGTGREFFLGQIKLALSAVGTSLQVNVKKPSANIVPATVQWWNDNNGTSASSGLQAAATTMSVNATGVTITVVPEPSAFGMVLVGALGLVGFRRLGFRRTA